MVDKHGRPMNQTAAAKAQAFALASLRNASELCDYGHIEQEQYRAVFSAFRVVVKIAQEYAP